MAVLGSKVQWSEAFAIYSLNICTILNQKVDSLGSISKLFMRRFGALKCSLQA
jgi:hypothetical protein